MIKLIDLIKEKEDCAIALMQYEFLIHSNATRACELMNDNIEFIKVLKDDFRESTGIGQKLAIERNKVSSVGLGALILDQQKITKALKSNIRKLDAEIKKHLGAGYQVHLMNIAIKKTDRFKVKMLSLGEMYHAIKKTILT